VERSLFLVFISVCNNYSNNNRCSKFINQQNFSVENSYQSEDLWIVTNRGIIKQECKDTQKLIQITYLFILMGYLDVV